MKLLHNWMPDSLLQALGWTLVHSLWQLILIAGLLWLVLRMAHRATPALKYSLSVGAMVLSLAVVLGTFSYEFNLDSSRYSVHTLAAQSILSNPSIEVPSGGVESTMRLASVWVEQNIPFLVNFWFFGSLLFLFRLVNSLSEIRILRKSSMPVTDFQLEKIAYRLAGKMRIKKVLELRISESAVSPLTFGTFKPIVLLPAGLIFQLSPMQLEAIIAHELAHVKRNDYLINLLLSGLEVIFFFHPCYWWMNQTVKELRENAADDLAIKVGVEPKNLATGLAEVLNFARQNPPELAQAAGKKRNPTLQRIKRILGYPAQNYPQNPIISIPMLLTLTLSLGLMASAQQDAPKSTPIAPSAPSSKQIAPAFPPYPASSDTTPKKRSVSPEGREYYHTGKNVMIISDGDNSYRISGDTLISKSDTIVLSGKTKLALDQLRNADFAPIPAFDIPLAPSFPVELELAPIPDFNFEFPALQMEALASIPMEPMPPMEPMEFAFDQIDSFQFFFSDTVKMTQNEREKMAKDMAKKSEEWSKLYEERAKEWAKRRV